MMRSSNPILTREGAFRRGAPPSAGQLSQMYNAPSYTAPPLAAERPMTIDDVVLRTAATLGTILVVGAAAWALDLGIGFAVLGALAGFALAMVNIFKRKVSPPLILAYAACEGLFLGVISHFFNTQFSSGNPLVGSIVTQAVIGTTLAFVGVLAAYSLRVVRVTQKFTRYVVGAGIALVGLMVVNLLAGLFIPGGLGLRSGGTASIIFSVIAIAVGCLFLLLDFNEIEQGVRMGAPKSYAWMCAFGLTVTLVWIYLEILRLLSYFRQ
jgi:uncharacterized YccA/Bax inhibitor family protein